MINISCPAESFAFSGIFYRDTGCTQRPRLSQVPTVSESITHWCCLRVIHRKRKPLHRKTPSGYQTDRCLKPASALWSAVWSVFQILSCKNRLFHINPHFCTVFLYHKFEHKYIPAQSFCITNLNISTFLHVENSIFHMCFHTKRGIALRHATFLFCHICFVFKTYCHARKILPVPTVPIIRLMQVLQWW